MSKPLPVGLIASGRMIESLLIRHPALACELGPVVASSRRLASRYANALKAGHPAEMRELGQCRLVLIQTPVSELPAILEELSSAPIAWKSKVVALLDDDMDASALRPLRDRRAAVGSVSLAPTSDRGRLVVEGDAAAVRVLCRWATQARLRCIELKPQSKALYGAGLLAANSLLSPVLDCALRSLRAAGLSQLESRQVLSLVVDLAVRDQKAHGRKAWLSPSAQARRPSVLRQLAALNQADPVLATFFQDLLIAAMHYHDQESDWLAAPRPPGWAGTD